MAGSQVEHAIGGAYQLDALLRGWAPQRAWHRARLDLVAFLLPPTGESLVLDAAAGSGIVTWKFQRANIVSTDMRLNACRFVRDHTAGARAVASELSAMPFRSGTFSRLYFLEAIEHLSPDAGRMALRELRRVARTGARCLITTPNYHSCWILLERFIDRLHLTPPMANGQHLSRYHAAALAAAVESAGWRVVRAGSFNLFAPLLGMFSARTGAWAVQQEVNRLRRAGTLLFFVCEAVGS